MPRGARAQPARRDRGRAHVDARRRRRGRGDRHLPGQPPEARGVGARRAHARDQHEGRADRAQGRGRRPLRRGLDRPDRASARQRRPHARQDHLPRARGGVHRAGAGPDRRRRRPPHHRDRPGHPRGEGRDLRRARGIQAHRPRGADPDERLAPAERRQDAPRHGHPGRAHDAYLARRGRDRAELLDRPRGHARRDPLPRREQPAAGALHPERRPAAAGPGRRDDLPRGARPARERAPGVRGALRHLHRRRLLRHDARPHRGDRGPRGRPRRGAAPRHARGARVVDDDRHAARAGAAAHAGGRARELAGLAQGEGAAARRRLRRHPPDRRGPGDRRRARARHLRGAHRAPGRGRPDVGGREARVAHPAGAAPDRLDRAGGDPGRARAHSRPGDRQLDQPRGRARQARHGRAARQVARRRA